MLASCRSHSPTGQFDGAAEHFRMRRQPLPVPTMYHPFPALQPSGSRARPPRKHAEREPLSCHAGLLADQRAACALIPPASAQPSRRRSSRGRIHDRRACRRCSRTPASPTWHRPSGRDRPRTACPLRSPHRTRTSTRRSASPSLFPHPSSTISPPGRVLAPRGHPPAAGSPSTWTALCAPSSRDTRGASVAASERSTTAREMLAAGGRGHRHRRLTGARVQGRQGLSQGGQQVSGISCDPASEIGRRGETAAMLTGPVGLPDQLRQRCPPVRGRCSASAYGFRSGRSPTPTRATSVRLVLDRSTTMTFITYGHPR